MRRITVTSFKFLDQRKESLTRRWKKQNKTKQKKTKREIRKEDRVLIKLTPCYLDTEQQDWCERCCPQVRCGQWLLSRPSSTAQQHLKCRHALATPWPGSKTQTHTDSFWGQWWELFWSSSTSNQWLALVFRESHLLWRRADARNVSSRNSLQWPIDIINSVDKTKLSCTTPPVSAQQFL